MQHINTYIKQNKVDESPFTSRISVSSGGFIREQRGEKITPSVSLSPVFKRGSKGKTIMPIVI